MVFSYAISGDYCPMHHTCWARAVGSCVSLSRKPKTKPISQKEKIVHYPDTGVNAIVFPSVNICWVPLYVYKAVLESHCKYSLWTFFFFLCGQTIRENNSLAPVASLGRQFTRLFSKPGEVNESRTLWWSSGEDCSANSSLLGQLHSFNLLNLARGGLRLLTRHGVYLDLLGSQPYC